MSKDRINVNEKIELKVITNNSTLVDFFEVFQFNQKLVGSLAVKLDVYYDFIKILCVFPLKGKKLKYFLSLKPTQKTGYMSKYIMKVARQVGVPKALIDAFFSAKEMSKLFNTDKLNVEEIGELFKNNIEGFLNEYSYTIKSEDYNRQLSHMTNTLCSAIFEQYDKKGQ